MTIHTAIPTTYRGHQMRSRLEAKWACCFDQLGWTWEYEPFDLKGWIPDFLVTSAPALDRLRYRDAEKKPFLIEIKPLTDRRSDDYSYGPHLPDDLRDKLEGACGAPPTRSRGGHTSPEKSWNEYFATRSYDVILFGGNPKTAWSWCDGNGWEFQGGPPGEPPRFMRAIIPNLTCGAWGLYALARQAGALLLGITLWLVGVVPSNAKIPVSRFGAFGVEEKTERASTNLAGRLIDKTPGKNDRLVARNHFLINASPLQPLNDVVAATQAASGRIDHLDFERFPHHFAFINERGNPFHVFAVQIVCGGRRESFKVIDEFARWLPTAIQIVQRNLKVLADDWSFFRFGVAWSDPSSLSLRRGQIGAFGLFSGDLGLFGGSISGACGGVGGFFSSRSLFPGSYGLVSNRSVNLDHLVHLPTNRNERQRDQTYCYAFSNLLSAIFASLFAAIGATLCFYCVNKSRKIGGYALWFWIGSLPFFFVSLWFVFEGLFGWDVRHVSASCNRFAENVRVVPVVVAELKFRDVQRHIFATHLVERAHDAALKDRPEALNRIRVDCADNVLLGLVLDLPARIFFQAVINWAAIWARAHNETQWKRPA